MIKSTAVFTAITENEPGHPDVVRRIEFDVTSVDSANMGEIGIRVFEDDRLTATASAPVNSAFYAMFIRMVEDAMKGGMAAQYETTLRGGLNGTLTSPANSN